MYQILNVLLIILLFQQLDAQRLYYSEGDYNFDEIPVYENYNESLQVPLKIWQTYKSYRLPKDPRSIAIEWARLNPEFEYNIHDDIEIFRLIKDHFTQDDTLQMIQNLTSAVMKADWWRYAIVQIYGGFYGDIDLWPHKPIREWKHYPFGNKVIIGLETGREWDFCQWAFIGPPQHPLYAHVTSYLVKKWNRDREGYKKQPDHVQDFNHMYTGPRVWSEAINDFFQQYPELPGHEMVREYRRQGSRIRAIADRYNIILEDGSYFQKIGGQVEHLYGSRSFFDGYQRWIVNNTKHTLPRDIAASKQLRSELYVQKLYPIMLQEIEYVRFF